MAKKGGKKGKKGGAKATAAAAVDKAAENVKDIVNPTEETTKDEPKTESVDQTQAPVESQDTAAPVTESEAETETEKKVEEAKETVKEPETAAPVTAAPEPLAPVTIAPVTVAPVTETKDESAVQDAVDKVQASKAGHVSALDNGANNVLPESSVKETSLGADTYPSTTETAAEESNTSTAAIAPFIAERPKTAESAKVSAPITAAEPVTVPSETHDLAHTKRPYEKPIFSNDEVKPPKMPRTEEEQATAADKSALGAGPAATAATAPEPVPVSSAPKEVETETSKANPDAVAAANAAINAKADKSTAESEVKKPEAAVKRGQEHGAPTETAQEAGETKADEAKISEQTEQAAEKKKGGFWARLKRMFK